MLDLLSFKKSLFEGVLDGGQNEVFLGGSRLKKFMESVERVTGNIPPSLPSTGASGDPESAEKNAASDQARQAAEWLAMRDHRAGQALLDILSAGKTFLDRLSQALSSGHPQADPGDGKTRPGRRGLSGLPSEVIMPGKAHPMEALLETASRWIVKEEGTGRPYFKLPVPKPETLQKIAGLFRSI